jgi:hypothetical protein
MERFDLHIDMGNDAMQNELDVAEALDVTAVGLRRGELEGYIRDLNGNTVGRYSIAVYKPEPSGGEVHAAVRAALSAVPYYDQPEGFDYYGALAEAAINALEDVALEEATRYTRTSRNAQILTPRLSALPYPDQHGAIHPVHDGDGKIVGYEVHDDAWRLGLALAHDEIVHGNSYVDSAGERIDPAQVAVWIEPDTGGLWAATLSDPFTRRRMAPRADRSPAVNGACAWRLEAAEEGAPADTKLLLGAIGTADTLENAGLEATPEAIAELMHRALGAQPAKRRWWHRLGLRRGPYTHTFSGMR